MVSTLFTLNFICGFDREQQANWRAERAQQDKELRESERSDQREALNLIQPLSQQR